MRDLIDRQEAIDAFDSYILDETTDLNGNTVREVLEKMPPAQPERKKGKWVDSDYSDPCWYVCSECGRQTDMCENYCPNCGADMRGETW